jgi:phage protein D
MKQKKALSAKSQAGAEVSKMGGKSGAAAIANSAFGRAAEVMTDQPVMIQAEADKLAKARFNRLALELISGEGVSQGRTALRPGIVMTIAGLGTRFSGQYYVTSAVHRYTPGSGYLTEFTVRRNAS